MWILRSDPQELLQHPPHSGCPSKREIKGRHGEFLAGDGMLVPVLARRDEVTEYRLDVVVRADVTFRCCSRAEQAARNAPLFSAYFWQTYVHRGT